MTVEVCLANVVVTATGSRNPTAEPEAEFVYVDVAAVDNERKLITGAKRLLGSDAPSRARKVLRTGDVLVSTVRPNLNAVALVTDDLDDQIASTGFCVLRARREAVLPEFLFYFARSHRFIEGLAKLVAGAMYPAVTDRQVLDQRLTLPGLDEQRRIVDLLSRAEGIVRLRREAKAKAQAIIPALFLDMLGDPATNPKGWDVVTIGEVANLVTSGSTPRGGAEVYVPNGPYFIRSQNVLMNHLVLSGAARIPPSVHDEMCRTKVREGDVLLNITGTSIGRVAWVGALDGEANVNQHVCIIRLNPDCAAAPFLSVCLSLPFHQRVINTAQAGASRQALNHQQVRALRIALPPLSLQRQFSERLASLLSISSQQSEALKKADATFQALLSRAFSGDPIAATSVEEAAVA